MLHAALIHNPCGGSANDEELERARALLSEHFTLDVHLIDAEHAPRQLAERALSEGATVLIASGGDGTVSSVAAAIVGRDDATLGIIPRGTANSIAGHLGITRELEQACAVISGGHTRLVDTASVNEQPMLLMATVGLHADAITEADPERKRRFGALAYVIEEAERMLDDQLFEITISANDQEATCIANAITVANMAPPHSLLAQGPAEIVEDDGLLDVTIVAIRGLAEAVATSFHLATTALMQKPAERDNIGFFRTAEIHISTKEPKRVMIDGEDATETPLVIRALPRSLRVLAPKLEQ
jgi:YegS/Rv2252/BmrU family lipid kinase